MNLRFTDTKSRPVIIFEHLDPRSSTFVIAGASEKVVDPELYPVLNSRDAERIGIPLWRPTSDLPFSSDQSMEERRLGAMRWALTSMLRTRNLVWVVPIHWDNDAIFASEASMVEYVATMLRDCVRKRLLYSSLLKDLEDFTNSSGPVNK